MIYLLALLIPISFLYSPPVEKTGAVYVTKTMHISHERKTPAYTLFQQAQKITRNDSGRSISSLDIKTQTAAEVLELKSNGDLLNVSNSTVIKEMSFSKADLLVETDKALNQMILAQSDSSLLNKLQDNKNNPFQNVKQSDVQAASIQGYFELTEGVGITNHKVTLRRVREGQSIEVGQVDLRAGMYQIFVNSFDGELVAEVRDPSGIIIGEDRKKIAGLSRRNNYFQGPQLRLGRPSEFALNLNRADDQKILEEGVSASFFSGNYLVKKTTDVYPNVARHSSTGALINSEDGKLARTFSVRTAKDTSQIMLFSQNWISGVKDYLSEKLQIQYIPQAGFIVGRIIRDGKPVANAQVMIENHPGIEPYYLDQFLIPQVKQSNTGTNGYFVIPGLSSGSYQVVAYVGNHAIGSQAYFVEENIVTYQEVMTASNVKVSTVRSFDAFTGNNVATDLQIPGLEDLLSLESVSTTFASSAKSGLMEIINRPTSAEYIPYIYLQNHVKDYMHLPQLSEKFIDHLQATVKQNLNLSIQPETAMIIGFAQMKKYTVTLADDQFDRRNIVYFNSLGEVSVDPVEDGGFAILNTPVGIQEVIVENHENEKISSQVFYAKDSMTYLAHFAD